MFEQPKQLKRLLLLATVSTLAACDDGGGKGHGEVATHADTLAETSVAETSADTNQPEALEETSVEVAQEEVVVSPTCVESDLDGCEYPERGLTVTVLEGFEITDATTGRVLPLLMRVPSGAGPVPVVIWSHGGGFNDNGHHLGAEWGAVIASQGYAVVHLAHVTATAQTANEVCRLASVPSGECSGHADEDSGLLAVFRTFDIIGVLDKLQGLSDRSVAGGGPAFDLSRVVVAGWSGGSRAPVVLMGASVIASVSAPRFSKPDLRVKAAIGLSPTGPGFGGFFDDGGGAATSWDVLRGPMLFATGSNDVKPDKPDLNGPVRRFPYTAQPGDGTRWLLYSNLPVGVGAHGTFNLGDDGSSDERLARLSRALRSTVRAFLDAHLKEDAAAKAWLGTGNAKVLAGDVDWEHR